MKLVMIESYELCKKKIKCILNTIYLLKYSETCCIIYFNIVRGGEKMKAIITVVGHDKVGIIAGVSGILAEANVNILDINQTVLQEYFTMMMLVDMSDMKISLGGLNEILKNKGDELGMSIRVQHEDIFKSMHQI